MRCAKEIADLIQLIYSRPGDVRIAAVWTFCSRSNVLLTSSDRLSLFSVHKKAPFILHDRTTDAEAVCVFFKTLQGKRRIVAHLVTLLIVTSEEPISRT